MLFNSPVPPPLDCTAASKYTQSTWGWLMSLKGIDPSSSIAASCACKHVRLASTRACSMLTESVMLLAGIQGTPHPQATPRSFCSMVMLTSMQGHWIVGAPYVCYEAPVLLLDGSKFRVRSLGLVRNFTKVKRDGGFLDIGFSLCTAPTFCRSLYISDRGLGFGGKVWS